MEYANSYPLHMAASDGDVEECLRLLDSGCPVSARDDSDDTPLHLAASEGNALVMALLAERGADPNARNTFGRTPAHEAAEWCAGSGEKSVMQALLKNCPNRVDLSLPDGQLRTPLGLLADSFAETENGAALDRKGHLEMAREFVRRHSKSHAAPDEKHRADRSAAEVIPPGM
jgi:hypothetical protein